jgi:hypothetical protein
MSQVESEPLAIGARWVRKSQSDSGGYSAFSFSSVRCRYISLPKAFDQSAQLVPGASGDNMIALCLHTPCITSCSDLSTCI